MEKRQSWFLVPAGKNITQRAGRGPPFPVETVTRASTAYRKSWRNTRKKTPCVWFGIDLCYRVCLSAFLTLVGRSPRRGGLPRREKRIIGGGKRTIQNEVFFRHHDGLFLKNPFPNKVAIEKVSVEPAAVTCRRQGVGRRLALLTAGVARGGFGAMWAEAVGSECAEPARLRLGTVEDTVDPFSASLREAPR